MEGPMGMHADVMKANPDTAEAKERLFEALKERGGNEFKSKRLPCAIKLYRRALKFAPSKEKKAIIYSNLSLTYATMNNGPSALSEADACLKLDATNPKAHFRRGQALVVLRRIPESHKAFEEAAKLDPSSKLYAKGVRLSQKRLDEYVPDLEPEKKPEKKAPTTTSSVVASKPPPKLPAASKTSEKPAPKKAAPKGSEEMRGYKIVNGKKTSYFHHEMTEEEKRLIGDITPQRIDPNQQAAAVAPKVAEGMSEWNSKGTFEDRDILPWAKQKLPELLVDQSVPCGSCNIRVTAVKDVAGLCSIAFIKQRKRFLFELSATIEWVASGVGTDDGESGKVSVAKGKLKLRQICHDDEDGDDIVPKFESTKAAAVQSDQEAIKRSVVRGEFFKKVASQIQEFRKQFFAL